MAQVIVCVRGYKPTIHSFSCRKAACAYDCMSIISVAFKEIRKPEKRTTVVVESYAPVGATSNVRLHK